MIFFLAKGLLGNHIFQLGFLKKYNKKRTLMILPEIDDVFNLFQMPRDKIWFPRHRVLRSIFYRFIDKFMAFLARWHIISSVQQAEHVVNGWLVPDTRIVENAGLFSSIIYVKHSFFQSDKLFEPKFKEELVIRQEHLDSAKIFLSQVPKSLSPVFIHVRQTDYSDFRVMGTSPLLSNDYYRRAIVEIQARLKRVHFILLGDDVEYLEKNFDFLSNKSVSRQTREVDFAIMTLCRGGVISNSSFAWWGGYLMADNAVVLAPKYWLGLHHQVWWPDGIKTKRFIYIDANPN